MAIYRGHTFFYKIYLSEKKLEKEHKTPFRKKVATLKFILDYFLTFKHYNMIKKQQLKGIKNENE